MSTSFAGNPLGASRNPIPRHRTIVRLSAVLAVVALATGCGDGDSATAPPTPEPARPTTVTVSPATHELTALGITVQLSAEVRDQNARVMAGATVTWTSSASSMATVDASGLVTAAGNGTATITASAGSASGSAVVTVMQSVASVEVSPSVYELTALGQTVQLTAEAFDENGHAVAGAEFSWESSDAAVATVDAGGLVTAVAEGVATITASAGEASGSAVVPVMQPVASVEVSPSAETIELGSTLQLTAEAFDENGEAVAEVEFAWETSDAAVAAVDAGGLVTGVAVGTATITASAGSGQGTAEVTVADLDRAALVALYEATDGPNWVNSENWLTDAPLGEWYGVETDRSGRVVDLRMAENALSGPIPPELGDLYNLTLLDLGGNRLTGSIPPELGNLANLDWLQLAVNALTGPIPTELGGLTNLQTLYIFRNALSGPLPRSLLELESLRTLSFGSNDGLCAPGTADFSEWLEGLPFSNGPYCNESDRMVLRSLYEAATGTGWSDSRGWLEGVVLDEWYGVGTDPIGRVTELDLNRNGLAGRLPPQLGQMARMTELRIGGNSLSGRLPESLTALSLRELHYADTELCTPPDASFRSWLTTISSHEGTGVECAPLSERDILVALYDATLGPGWTNSDNWLTDASLGEWYGVNVNGEGRVVSLDLSSNSLTGPMSPELGSLSSLTRLVLANNDLTGPMSPELGSLSSLTRLDLANNDLTGPIPPELGDLAHLTYLDLANNDLTGPIPPELGDLAHLTYLDLGVNKLTGPIPPALGNLASLTGLGLGYNELSGAIPSALGNLASLDWLNLGGNELTGAIPSALGNLASLDWLDLGGNELTGAIPSALGNLASLDWLDLGGNELTGLIPPELGRLSSLTRLLLADNELTGPIPPELGSLAGLESLFLLINDLQGAVPPELSGMASLRELALSRNPRLSGDLPLSLTALSQLAVFVAQGTDLCAPSDADFLNWLDGIPVQRVARCAGARAMTYLTQAVQSPEFPVPLVADEEALLRVFVTASRSNDQRIPPVRATLYRNGAQSHVVNLPGKPGPIPTAVQEGELETSANARIPGRFVQPGLEMVIEVDPERTLDPGLGVTKRIPETGRLAVEVRAMPLFDLTVIPFRWTESSGSSILDITEGLTADSDLLWETRTLLPVDDFDVTVHTPVFSSTNDAYDLLRQTAAIRTMEGGSGYYMGTMTQPVTPVAGLGLRRGRVSFSVPVGWIMAHEFGHNMSLQHTWTNPLFPSYPGGRIGVWGYDFRNGGRLVPPDVNDVMLGQGWISDFHFTQALHFRRSDADGVGATRATGPAPTKSLLLWGGVGADGVPYLDPAFVINAPPALPDAAGEYRLAGHTAAGGRELFSVAFAMPEVADGDGSSGFVFALPVQPGWERNLATITLSGPGGSVTLDADTDRPMAILRNPRTGQVRGILRDLPPAMQTAGDAAARAGGTGLEMLFSRGIPDAAAWRR